MSQTSARNEANAEQVHYWNNVGGPKWVRLQALLDRQLEAIGHMAMDAAGLKAGESVLDVGCGCGSTTLDLARRVGPSGKATGIDISHPMLELARKRAASEGLSNATFTEADAQTFAFAPEYDVLYSRFGVMFFDDPTAAFTNLRGALRPGARVSFACWQAIDRNPWMGVPLMAALQHVSMPAPPDPNAPGPMAFANPDRVRGILDGAAFGGVSVDSRDVELVVGGGTDLDETTRLVMDLGPIARLLADADDALRTKVHEDVQAAIAGYATAEGVKMPGGIWLVTATA